MSVLLSLLGFKKHDDRIQALNSAEFNARIHRNKVQIVDFRTPREFNHGHIKGAININFYSGSFASEVEQLEKSKPVYVYCRSGSRSKMASIKLASLGFVQIFDLKGGLMRWGHQLVY